MEQGFCHTLSAEERCPVECTRPALFGNPSNRGWMVVESDDIVKTALGF